MTSKDPAAAPPLLASDEEYARRLRQTTFWEPWMRAALEDAGLPPPGRWEPGEDPTYPTFLTDTGVAVKLFGDRWHGPDSHAAEVAAYERLRGTNLPVPSLVARGELFPGAGGWPWPYLVLGRVPGTAYVRRSPTLGSEARVRLAHEIGRFLRRLHTVPLGDADPLRPDWEGFLALLRRRRREAPRDHGRWGRLLPSAVADLETFLPSDPTVLVDRRRPPVFLHGDLHDGHLFVEGPGPRLSGVIDFTDARAGDPRYDLVALHLGTFRGDKALLEACLEGYQWPSRGEGWPRVMLALTLLHDFDVLAGVPGGSLQGVASLDALADLLWNPTTPGLEALRASENRDSI